MKSAARGDAKPCIKMPRYKLRDANGATRVLTLDEQASYADLVASCGGRATP